MLNNCCIRIAFSVSLAVACCGYPVFAGEASPYGDQGAVTCAKALNPEIMTTSLPDGTVGWEYSATMEADGGVPPYAWSVVVGGRPSEIPLGGTYCNHPQWHPDGQWLCFHGGQPGRTDIYITRPDGCGFRKLTKNDLNLMSPSFSPDGLQLVFSELYGPLYTMDLDGVGMTPLPVGGMYPRWSPVGNKIVFSNWDVTYNADIFVYDLDENVVSQVTDHVQADVDMFYYAAWSPDGTRLGVAARGRDYLYDVWVMNADGSDAVNLTADWGGSNQSHPTWSPDGRYLAFTSDVCGDYDIWAIRLDGSEPPQMIYGTPGLDEVYPEICPAIAGAEVGFVGRIVFYAVVGSARWHVVDICGSLPDGLELDPWTGEISGVPTVAGTWSFMVHLADSSYAGCGDARAFTLTVHETPPVVITTQSLPGGCQNAPYSAMLEASGGVAPYTWSIASGSLPAGLWLDSSTGEIGGTPLTAGTASFTVEVTDCSSTVKNDHKAFSLSIVTAPAVPLRLRVTGIEWFDDCHTATIHYEANSLVQQYYYRLYQAGPSYMKTSDTSVTFTGLRQGTYMFVVTGRDMNGQFAEAPCRVWFHNKPVGDSFQVYLQSYEIDHDAVILCLEANQPVLNDEYYVRLLGHDSAYTAIDGRYVAYTGLSDGRYHFAARARDAETEHFPRGGPARQFFYIVTDGFDDF